MERFKIVSFAVFFLTIGALGLYGYTTFSPNGRLEKHSPHTTVMTCESSVELKINMRKLWEDHATWTRNVILCLVDELPGKEQAIKRLHQNQVDIGNSIKPYYGEEAGKKLTSLLNAHINISFEVIREAKAGNTVALDKENKKWYTNANEISAFLNKANSNWELIEMKTMMNDHLKLTTDEVVSRIKKNYDEDILAYDKVHTEILMMADMLTEGIIKQFPKKFETCGAISKLK